MKRVLLMTMGLMFVAGGYFGCLPADSGTTTGAAGTMGTGNTSGGAGTTGAGNVGAAGNTGVAGDTGQGGGGNDQGTAGTTGGSGPQGTAGSTGGSGPQGTAGSTGGSGAAAGRGGAAGGGAAGRGGAAGGGVAGAGAGGRGGAAGSGPAGTGGSGPAGAGGGGNLMAVAAPLDGQMLTGPCMQNTEASVCATVAGACPDQNNSDIALRGVKTTDKMITLGGTPGVNYTIVLHVQGEVESKNYTGGMDQLTTGSSPNLDGWRVGGTPNTGNAYNVYMLRVRNPGSTTDTTYYLNSLDPPGVENHTTYGINYTTPASGALAFVAQGGATVRIVAADSNCSMIKNCGPNPSGATCLAPIIIQNVEPTSVQKNSGFNFTTAYNGQWIVMTVKSVTQN